ncbi:asparagine--tRNA ligase [Megalodesulfovibrio gigas]|uniref:Asparagine--tRNA ligase n=1 Tax=Megalodesulfovibrio gigas (strain ATCC 19364 / DSM 1382 / NCIMB 9332 / VKM B-1759) TaxID=1121448 RepID=T2G8F0_MEGG1|nr:asparagine--tRNA ligase [Megalodesulfovibrio gigas]AGW12421.1 putative asparaginyl-tRNA synthetase [Megalodesulfovibrio gigas DSM 1382 = ATCC 19364]
MHTPSIKTLLASLSPLPSVLVRGWVRTRRDAKGFSFLELNDGSCLANLQCVVDETVPGGDRLKEILTGAAVAVQGELIPSPAKGQQWELKAVSLELIGPAPEDYPLQKKRHSDEFLRSIAHLRPRTNKFGALFRIRSEASFAVHDFFRNQGFTYVHTPILTGSDCEGAGELFRVTALPRGSKEDAAADFFGRDAFLTVSGQLEAEPLALSLGKVYTFGPTFRAENSNTARHAAEFWMIEPEMAFFDLTANMDLAEAFVKAVARHLLDHCAADLALFNQWVDKECLARLTQVADAPFERLEYREAVRLLQAACDAGESFQYPVAFGTDLQTEHERYLAEKKFGKPVFLCNYPASIKPFYMRVNDDQETVAAMDLLVPTVGELIGGSQREERLEVLQARMQAQGLDPAPYWWYLELRQYGSAPHAGFGLGFERLLMFATGIPNIRDVIAYPRTPGSLEF